MSNYRPTIGLEVHAELGTLTKMFCSCLNNPDEKEANKNICPVCMAHPGSLPVINKEAIHKVLLVGTAVGAQLAHSFSEFDRKNYFYPDIPKGYQISQYLHPLVKGGVLAGVELTRIHLEEDTARSQHVEDPDKGGKGGVSLVDYNRAGVPLMELVTEPVIHDAETAGKFARELQLLLRYLGAGEANMEKGEMRVEANISVANVTPSKAKESPLQLGTKVEVKNLNSFRSVERAIAYEIERQSKLLESGGEVIQETRGWDEAKQVTFSQRKKESSHDYRYFPDPDLPKLALSEIKEFSAEQLKKELPELPWERRERYMKLKIAPDDADMFVRANEFGDFFDFFLSLGQPTLTILGSNYLASDIAGKIEKGEISLAWLTEANARRFVSLMHLGATGILSSRGMKDTLAFMFADVRDPETIAKEKGLIQQSDSGALSAVAQKIIDAYPQVVADYRAGKEAALQFMVGQGMKETKGSANPGVLRQAILELLK